MYIKKIRKTKSFQCFADFLIQVFGGFFAKYKMQLNTCSYVNKIIQRKVQPLPPRFEMATKCRPPPSPVENPRKLKEKSRQDTTRCSVGYLIQSGYIRSCFAAQNRFLLFTGPGSLKNFKNRRKCRVLKAYVLCVCYVASIFLLFGV
jgi:hypothetical protein